jgi:hypothetical protein
VLNGLQDKLFMAAVKYNIHYLVVNFPYFIGGMFQSFPPSRGHLQKLKYMQRSYVRG